MGKHGPILRKTGFKDIPLYPGFMSIEVDENGKEAGPINWAGFLAYTGFAVILFVGVPLLLVVFMVIEALLGVSPNG